jgi:hypothetical protein
MGLYVLLQGDSFTFFTFLVHVSAYSAMIRCVEILGTAVPSALLRFKKIV